MGVGGGNRRCLSTLPSSPTHTQHSRLCRGGGLHSGQQDKAEKVVFLIFVQPKPWMMLYVTKECLPCLPGSLGQLREWSWDSPIAPPAGVSHLQMMEGGPPVLRGARS